MDRFHRIWTRPVTGMAWLGGLVIDARRRRSDAAWARETADVENVAARIARCDLTSDLTDFRRKL